MKFGAKRAELVQLLQMFVSRSCVGIFRNERTRSTPLDTKLTFCTLWVHSGPFGCLTKIGAKRTELVQKFVPWSRVGIFCNERTWSTPLTLNSRFGAFLTIWVHSGPFGYLTKLGAKRAEVVQKFVPRSHVGIFRNERARYTTFDLKLTFWCVSYHFCAFGIVGLPYETRCKTGRTSAKVRATKSRRNFPHRTHPIHPIGP